MLLNQFLCKGRQKVFVKPVFGEPLFPINFYNKLWGQIKGGYNRPTIELVQTGPSLFLKFQKIGTFQNKAWPSWSNLMVDVANPLPLIQPPGIWPLGLYASVHFRQFCLSRLFRRTHHYHFIFSLWKIHYWQIEHVNILPEGIQTSWSLLLSDNEVFVYFWLS